MKSRLHCLLSAQLTDEHCRRIHQVFLERQRDNDAQQIHKEYLYKNNRIYKVTSDGPRWLVPKRAKRALTSYYHDSAGHSSLGKILSTLSKNYSFPIMRKYVNRYICCCLMCAYNQEPSGKGPGVLNPIEKVSAPMDTVHIDHLGPFVKSTKGNSDLIVAVDAFTL